MLKPGHLIFATLALLMAGCSAPPRKGAAVPTNWESGESPSQPSQPFQAIPMQPSPPPVALLSPHLPAWTWPTEGVAESWMTLDHWCQMNQLSLPVRTAALSVIYTVSTPHGSLVLRAGNRLAQWDGMELQLGFVPREVEGRLLIHVLDARKNLQPLLEALALPPAGSRTIVVDPGHGGGNTGTRSVFNQHLEKEYTLDWAQRLRPLLEANGWHVYLTRTNDAEVPLGDRVAFAEQHRADLFLSLHFNAPGSANGGQQAGLETYCLTPRGMPSNLTRDFEDDATKAYPNNTYDDLNLKYALRLHRALLSANGLKDRGVRHARFLGVLRGQNRPAVLLEGGYLSNPEEAKQISSPEYRQKLAEAVANALTP